MLSSLNVNRDPAADRRTRPTRSNRMNDRMMNRRGALKLFGAAALGAATSSQLVNLASAGRGWCFADPLFKVGNYVFDVALSANVDMLKSATGPVALTLYVPKKVRALHLLSDFGFGHGYDVDIETSSQLDASKHEIEVAVTVNAPAKDSDIPVKVAMTSVSTRVLISRKTASGYANQDITWRGKVDTISLLDSLIQL
jgi:hypothetical protein